MANAVYLSQQQQEQIKVQQKVKSRTWRTLWLDDTANSQLVAQRLCRSCCVAAYSTDMAAKTQLVAPVTSRKLMRTHCTLMQRDYLCCSLCSSAPAAAAAAAAAAQQQRSAHPSMLCVPA
jgi:hypothetical protein